jgi:hypothetical protein
MRNAGHRLPQSFHVEAVKAVVFRAQDDTEKKNAAFDRHCKTVYFFQDLSTRQRHLTSASQR